ncbi:hypothetical protein V6N11_018885 [Hibiscus sabdariffa]|uniref:Gag-pol polyprotein n=1 Tax=Hibiscus sabdariffa TaxID=183260 RepID=A0ABR2R120_9ROSI
MIANGIKFNGSNYDDWIEYVKLNANLLELDSALVMDEPTKPTAPNFKPSHPKTVNVREFVNEIKKSTMTDIVDKSVVATLIDDLSNREYTIAQSMDENITHMVNTYNQLKGLDMDLGERVFGSCDVVL